MQSYPILSSNRGHQGSLHDPYSVYLPVAAVEGKENLSQTASYWPSLWLYQDNARFSDVGVILECFFKISVILRLKK